MVANVAHETWHRSTLEYFKQGVADGNPYALSAYGEYYEYEMRDLALASEWNRKAVLAFEKAATAGNANAMGELSMIYTISRAGVPQDLARSNYWKTRYWTAVHP